MKEERRITVKGETYPCRVTMGAMVRFKRASGRDVSEISKNDVSDMVLFMWCCVASACKADDVAFDLSFDDFADALSLRACSHSIQRCSHLKKKLRRRRERLH